MKKLIFKGAATALVTPFNNEGIDFKKLEELIEFQIYNGIDAILVCGTTGEASTMSEEEQKSVIDFSVNKVMGRIPVIAGTGSNNTAHAVMLSRYAEKAGVDAVLCVTPYYNKTSQEGLYQHFKVIAQNVGIPLIIYNVPCRTGVNINPETCERLSRISNINAIKECNMLQAADVANKCKDELFIYSGEDGQILPMLSIGAAGVISVMANIIPKDTHRLVKSFFEGNINESRMFQFKALQLIKALFIEVNPMPVKAAMNLLNMDIGKCRLPLVEISQASMEAVRKALSNYGLMK